MTEQSLDSFITNFLQGQKQAHAHLLRQLKWEFCQLRDTQRRSRRAALHSHNPIAPPPKVGALPASLDDRADEFDSRR
jgi:hypothetical protein